MPVRRVVEAIISDQKSDEDKEIEKRRGVILKKMLETLPKPKLAK